MFERHTLEVGTRAMLRSTPATSIATATSIIVVGNFNMGTTPADRAWVEVWENRRLTAPHNGSTR